MVNNNELLRNFLSLKMQIASNIIELFPGEIRARAKQAESSIVSIIHELTGEYLEREKAGKKDGSLKRINIE